MHNVTVQISDGYEPGIFDCHCQIFAFDVAPDTFDVFFNSPVWYRAQFMRKPNIGQAANGWLLGRLLDKFLQLASAKILVYEDDFPFSDLT